MKKNLGKIIALGLVTASICSVTSAENLKGKYKTTGTGDPYRLSVKYDNKVANYQNIDIKMYGKTISRTTAFLTVKNSKNFNAVGGDKISIINTALGTPTWGVFPPNSDAVFALGGSTINLNAKNVYIAAIGSPRDDSAISAKNTVNSTGGDNTVNVSGGTVQIIGDLDFLGSTRPGTNKITLDLSSPNSFWYGSVRGAAQDKIATVSLTNGAQWIYDQNSSIQNLTLDGGIVNLDDKEIAKVYATTFVPGIDTDGNDKKFYLKDYRYKSKHCSVTIDNLNGAGGIFKLDLQYNDDSKNASYKSASVGNKSDYIFIKNGSGTHDVQFDSKNSNLDKMQNGDKLYFANDQSKGVEFISSTVEALPEKNSASDIYNYKYAVDSANAEGNHKGTDWFITLNENGTNENVTSVDGAMKAGYALGTEMDRLNKRLGESRYLSDEKGLWVRYRHARVGMDNSFKTNSNMFQLGYDKQVLEDDGTHYRGLALDYTHGDTSLLGLRGNGEHDRYSLSLYDTWMGDKGHYRDLVIRGGRINSEFDVDNSNSATISSDYHQWFGSISGEWGRKKDTGHDWYFEPQTQLQLARVGGADYVTNHGVRVEQDGATSLIGRLGFRLGREFDKNDAAKRDNYYIKADLMHEFCGDQEYRVTGKDGSLSKTYDGKDTWFDVGVGADITISRNTYFWVDVERTLGGDFDRTWQVNGGFRWEF